VTLAERLANTQPHRRRQRCRVAVVLDELDRSDRDALQTALDVPKYDPRRLTAKMIADALTAEGFPVHFKHVEHHRRNACGCESG
jgi:hypothetical protein